MLGNRGLEVGPGGGGSRKAFVGEGRQCSPSAAAPVSPWLPLCCPERLNRSASHLFARRSRSGEGRESPATSGTTGRRDVDGGDVSFVAKTVRGTRPSPQEAPQAGTTRVKGPSGSTPQGGVKKASSTSPSSSRRVASPKRRRAESKGPIIEVATCQPVSEAARPLANALRRSRGRARVQFANGRGILKALKVFAIAHDFLSQHATTLSLCPVGLTESLVMPSSGDGGGDDGDEDWEGSGHEGPSSSGREGEGLLELSGAAPLLVPGIPRQEFVCEVWRRPCERMEVDLRPGSRVPLLDFALDSRREWKSKTCIGMDMAYSIADMLYGQLVSRPCREGQQIPQIYVPPPPQAFLPVAPPVWSGPLLLSADMAQSTTLFMSLALLQRRLQHEGTPLKVVATIYRNTLAPRIDGRNGFVFKVHLSSSLTPPPGAAPEQQQQQQSHRERKAAASTPPAVSKGPQRRKDRVVRPKS